MIGIDRDGNRRILFGGVVLFLLCTACSESDHSQPGSASNVQVTDAMPVAFTDVTEAAGLQFKHVNGADGRRHLPETMGGSAAWFDGDGDSDLDLFLGQSGGLADSGDQFAGAQNAIYRNEGGTFVDVTSASGAAVRTGYGQGVAAGDADADGKIDLYVTNYGPNVLLKGAGDLTFTDVTESSGTGDPAWSCSAAFFDKDADGDLDLYVANYVKFSLTDYKRLSKDPNGFLAYPHPDQFKAARDTLYENDGSGHFVDRTSELGIVDVDGKGLGVATVDFDIDGDVDIYVANDSTPNFLFKNEGGRFVDWTTKSNTGYNRDGVTEASMGVAVGDIDGNQLFDIMVTNLDGETNTLYLNQGRSIFEDQTDLRGVAQPSLGFVGFGLGFLDFEFDGDLDILIGNGHIIDNIEQVWVGSGVTYAQRCLLHINEGKGRFRNIVEDLPPTLAEKRVIRALAFADYDEDGDQDVLMAQNDRPAVLLRNDSRRIGNPLSLKIVDARGHDAVGATVAYRSGETRGVATTLVSGSYCAASDPRIFIGTKAERFDEIEVRFVTGEKVKLENVAVRRALTIGPKGLLSERPLP